MQEMTDARISLPEHYIEIGDYRDESGFRAASRLVGLKEPPTALFVANSEMALGALTLNRPSRRQIKVPVPCLQSRSTWPATIFHSVTQRDIPGAGAAGGLGFGPMTFCAAELLPGFGHQVTNFRPVLNLLLLLVTTAKPGTLCRQTRKKSRRASLKLVHRK
jgi:Glycerate kinase family